MHTLTLGQVVDASGGLIQTGPFGSQLHAHEYSETGVAVAMPQNIHGGRLSHDNISHIPAARAARLARHQLRANDIIYSRRGDVEKNALVRNSDLPAICGTGCLLVRIPNNESFDARFLSYLLQTDDIKKWVTGHAVGATMPNLNTAILGEVPLEVPPLSEQQAIAEVLGALDDKIAANRALVATMEERLRATFSLNIRTGPARRLDEVLSFNPPRHISSSLAPQIPMQSLPTPSMVIDRASMAVPNGGAKFTNGDTLLARITPCLENGKTGFVSNLDDGAVGFGSTEYIVMRSIDPNPLALSYFVATDPMFRKEAIRRMIGTSGRQRVSAKDLSGLEFPITDRTEILQSFGREAAEQMELGRCLVNESATLASLCDMLLPALMDGTIRVKDAVNAAEEVL